MNENKMSHLSGSLLWFGAAVSIAEILTGTLLAPLGFGLGFTAIILGHVIGCVLMYFAGLMGAQSKMTAMETIRFSFGKHGSVFFSVLNVLQLVGWTAVMIISGAKALGAAVNSPENILLWCALIAVLIILWVAAGIKNVGKLNIIAVGCLFVLTAILGVIVFKNGGTNAQTTELMSFGFALELSIIMPLSWLPLISDYTKNTDKPVSFTFFSTLSYFLGSTFMYSIGLGAAVFMGQSDIVEILLSAGLGIAAMLIVLLSTVTTTYLDVYSAGESVLNINPKLNGKLTAVIVCIAGALIAMFAPIEQYQNFLSLIGSVFVPMSAILITDYFILRKRDKDKVLNITNSVLWVIGFVIYRIFLNIDTVIGSTIPVILIVSLLCVAINMIKNAKKHKTL